jgi:ABC-type polysaccharide/polyol phosphate export permease
MRLIIDFIRDLYANRFVIFQLTRRDLQNRYIGSVFGLFWHIVQPLVMLVILWFVLTQIFKSGTTASGVPFIAWLIAGLIGWNFFVEAISNATNVFQEFSYLVKKLNFRVAILPIVKILSALFTHGIFIIIAICILLFSGVPVSIYWLQIIYYLFALGMFLLGLSWLLSSLNVFLRDVSYFVVVFLQFFYWLTPIIWRIEDVPARFAIFFKANPLFYIVNGYRESLIPAHVPFWDHPVQTLSFWVVTLCLLALGAFTFRRLRPHFSDVL